MERQPTVAASQILLGPIPVMSSPAWSRVLIDLSALLNEFLVFHLRRAYELQHGIAEQIRVLPSVLSPLELIEVRLKMLSAHLMIRADDSPLKQAPRALYAVRMNIAAYPLFRAMVDRLMRCIGVGNAFVRRVLVGHETLGIGTGVFQHEAMQGFLGSAFLPLQPDLAAALDRTEHHRLAIHVSASNVFPFAADVGLVDLHHAT